MTVLEPLEPITSPLRYDEEEQTIYVGEAGVPLDRVIHAHHEGWMPERIVKSYPTLDLADVYAVTGYYLRHRTEIDRYVERRASEAAALRREIEALCPQMTSGS